MCFKSAPKVKPIAAAPTANPEVLDDTAYRERDRERKKARGRNGRLSTILAGEGQGSVGSMPQNAAAKTALGS